ncbi:MAG: ATP-grasp domain-containing protein [Actinobacteria bacterium]|nr:ATP-grasp domain-containing protein [Actinomycetota bacterium]
MRVLLTDGSGLTARQVATQLAAAGHTVEVLTPDPFALTRFTTHVRRVHRVPRYGTDPFAWLDAALAVYTNGAFDVLFPTHEQVAVLSRSPARLHDAGVVTAVPSFEALAEVQDKVRAHSTLTRLSLATPATEVARSAAELAAWERVPVFLKAPIGTATSGVVYATHRDELAATASAWDADGAFDDGGGALVQTPVTGPLVMVQSVFERGELVAAHANVRVREGTRGGASHKRSIDLPEAREHLQTLGAALRWHGALSADAILTDAGPVYIDVNPRLVEPGNAWRAGVDLVDALLRVARGEPRKMQAPGRADIATHQLLLAVTSAAHDRAPRRAVLRELLDAGRQRGTYRDSVEELTPLHRDPRTLIPVGVAVAANVVHPSIWEALSSGAVANYALTPKAWQALRDGGTAA